MALTAKQKVFLNEYLLTRNATEAAKKAGYSEKTAHIQGCRLLKQQNIHSEIMLAEANLKSKYAASLDRILTSLSTIAFWDIAEILITSEGDFQMKSLDKIAPEIRQLLQIELRTNNNGESLGWKISAPDRMAAIEMLGERLGLFSKDDKTVDKAELHKRLFERVQKHLEKRNNSNQDN